jgi:hypothetical protein
LTATAAVAVRSYAVIKVGLIVLSNKCRGI